MIGRKVRAAGKGSERREGSAGHSTASRADQADERGLVIADLQLFRRREELGGGNRRQLELPAPAVDIVEDRFLRVIAGLGKRNDGEFQRLAVGGDLNRRETHLAARQLLPTLRQCPRRFRIRGGGELDRADELEKRFVLRLNG